LAVTIAFSKSFGGPKNIYASATTNAGVSSRLM
jgi:hypothetical protein